MNLTLPFLYKFSLDFVWETSVFCFEIVQSVGEHEYIVPMWHVKRSSVFFFFSGTKQREVKTFAITASVVKAT